MRGWVAFLVALGVSASPASAQMSRDDAKAAATDLAKAARDGAVTVTTQTGAPSVVPYYAGTSLPESAYQNDPDALISAGSSTASTSDAAKVVKNPNRPYFDPKMIDVSSAKAIEDDPNSYTGTGLSTTSTASQCQPLPTTGGTPDYYYETCNTGSAVKDVDTTCTSQLVLTHANTLGNKYLCAKSLYTGFDNCTPLAQDGTCHLTNSFDLTGYNIQLNYYTCSSTHTEPTSFFIGTEVIPPPPGALEVINKTYNCADSGANSGQQAQYLLGDGVHYFDFGNVTVTFPTCDTYQGSPYCAQTGKPASVTETQVCASWDSELVTDYQFGFSYYINACKQWVTQKYYTCTADTGSAPPVATSPPEYFTQQWQAGACSAGSDCTYQGETCTGGTQTKVIDGISVTLPCWEKTKTYSCQTVVGGQSDCAAVEGKQTCSFDHEECLDDQCTVKNRVFKCEVPNSGQTAAPQYICSNDVYCINGDCQQVEREASTEFKDALVAMHALGQAKDEWDENSLTLFSGTATGCHKPIFGLVNCCAGKTSGLLSTATGAAALASGPAAIAALATPFLTTFLCSTEEKTLDVKDRMGLCHMIGTYCSQKVLFVCTTRRTTYCCFESKLTRVIQEQGRAQLGKTFGTPKSPQCGGFSIYEFQQLDLSKMDFTEVYKDFVDAAKLPDEVQTMQDIQARISKYYSDHGAN
ncbi:TraN [Sphingomonas sp. SKA58]|nr:TraN [Sphingomonas sp. SKA58]